MRKQTVPSSRIFSFGNLLLIPTLLLPNVAISDFQLSASCAKSVSQRLPWEDILRVLPFFS
jgi:hypothetical protein